MTSLKSITGLQYLNTDSGKYMNAMFYNCRNIDSLDLSHFNTEKVTDMSHVFDDRSSLDSIDISGFRTDSLKDTSDMFGRCNSLAKLVVGNVDLHDVTDYKDTRLQALPQMTTNSHAP